MTDKTNSKNQKEMIEYQELINTKYQSYIQQDLCKITALSFLIVLIDTSGIDSITWMKAIIGVSSITCILTTVYGLSLNSKWINTVIDDTREHFLESVMKTSNLLSNWSFVVAVISIIITKLYF